MRRAALLLGLGLGLAAAAGTAPASAFQRPPAARCAGRLERLGTPAIAYAAVPRSSAHAYHRPGSQPFARVRRLDAYGAPTVLGVRAAVLGTRCAAAWYEVQLPRRPNGALGYVRARDVRIGSVRTRIVVDLSARRLVLFRAGSPILETAVGIGKASTPTPRGRFYVTGRFLTGDPGGPYGPAALGLSAFSPTLTDWPGGGQVAIHGTNEPRSIGRAASYGCVHVRNALMLTLFRRTPAGTPVVIRL
jgi:L,D-transpeptidase catalytic domain